MAGCGGAGSGEGEGEGKDDFQDSGLGDLGLMTSGPGLGNTRGRSGPRRKMPSSVSNILTLKLLYDLQEVMACGRLCLQA